MGVYSPASFPKCGTHILVWMYKTVFFPFPVGVYISACHIDFFCPRMDILGKVGSIKCLPFRACYWNVRHGCALGGWELISQVNPTMHMASLTSHRVQSLSWHRLECVTYYTHLVVTKEILDMTVPGENERKRKFAKLKWLYSGATTYIKHEG